MLQGWIQIAITLLIVLLITPCLGGYIARIFLGDRTRLDRLFQPIEQVIYQLGDIRPQVTIAVS